MKLRLKICIVTFLLCCLTCLSFFSMAEAAREDYLKANVVGEAFGREVSGQEFSYYFKTSYLFTRSGRQDRSEEKTIQETWENLIFRQEAKNLNITISRPEIEE